MSLIVQNVSKKYNQQKVLENISFTMKEGEVLSILGPSGCGKSTLLQIVAGLQDLNDGEIRLNDQVISSKKYSASPETRGINMVFQDYALWPHLTVEKNIRYGLKMQKKPKEKRDAKVQFLLDLLQLRGLENRYPSELSGGQQQRVAIARALATEPKLLLLDEPLSNLDMQLKFEMRNELSKLLKEFKTTALHVTHDPLEAYALADKILILRNGHIEQFGTPHEVRGNPASLWVAGLLGMTNRVNGIAHSTNSIKIGDHIIRAKGQLEKDERCVLVTGTETTTIHRQHVDNSFAGVISHIVYEGEKWRLIIETTDGSVTSLTEKIYEKGDKVWVEIHPEKAWIYPDYKES